MILLHQKHIYSMYVDLKLSIRLIVVLYQLNVDSKLRVAI